MKISMKKRKIGYTYGSVSGHFAFRKQKSIAFESTLERDLLTILEFNDSVCDVIEQPITIEYINSNGRKTTYTPDFLVYFNQPVSGLYELSRKPLLIEVKPREIIRKKFAELRERFKIASKYALENDMVFKIFDERKIRGSYFEVISFLKRYKNRIYDDGDEERIFDYLSAVGQARVDFVLETLCVTKNQKGIMLGQIWHLIANKKLSCIIDGPLNYETIVWNNDILQGEKE
ncbi:MAG: TnsA endonuclease N-terminal domain-containing protein [Sulfurovaceae bacterium]